MLLWFGMTSKLRNNKMGTSISNALKQFLKTTTLHGFKYMNSPFYFDRVAWVICAVVGASCAGGLCAVLWARFTEVPALLALRDVRLSQVAEPMPLVAVCPTPATAARLVAQHLSLNVSDTKWLPHVFERLLRDLDPEASHLQLLEKLLSSRNLTLVQALMGSVPACKQMTVKCRWQNRIVPCEELFVKRSTHWGVCCILNPEELKRKYDYGGLNKRLAVALQCDDHSSDLNTCEFFIRYQSEVEGLPISLAAGSQYFADIVFTAVQDQNTDKLVDGSCVSGASYSRKKCLMNCGERFCGCSDPLRIIDDNETNVLPPCSIPRMSCLLRWKIDENCPCLPSCRKLNSDITIESSPLDAVDCSVDPF